MSNRQERWEMYGLIQQHSPSPRSARRFSIAGGSGNWVRSHSKSVQWYSFIQKQSKWNIWRGMSRSAMPLINEVTVSSS